MDDKQTYSISVIEQNLTVEKTSLLSKIILAPGISKSCKDVIVASQYFSKIKDRKGELCKFEGEDKEAIKVELVQHINNAINDSGYVVNTWDKKDINRLIITVRDDVLNNFFFLTTQEVGLAFYRGVREEYGEVVGLSARIFYKWLKIYCAREKLEANKVLIQIESNQVIEISEAEKQKRYDCWLEGMYKSFDEFKIKREYLIYDLNNMLYDLLKKKGLIEFTPKQRKKILEKATNQIKRNYDPLKAKGTSQRNEFLKVIESIQKKDKSFQVKVQSQAKHIGLEMYLTKLSKTNKSLKEVIEESSEVDINTKG